MLNDARKKMRLTQEQLSKKLNISQNYLCKLENGKFKNVNIELIKKISKELKLDPVDVFLFFYSDSS